MRYFLHIWSGGSGVLTDFEGAEFPDLAAARAQAVESMNEIQADRLSHAIALGDLTIAITDDQGHTFAVVVFNGAIEPQYSARYRRA